MNATTTWHYPRPFGTRAVAIVIAAFALLWITGQRVEIGRMIAMTGEAALATIGIVPKSEVADGFSAVVGKLFPLQISTRTDVARIENFDPRHLPLFAHVETAETTTQALNPDTLQMEPRTERTTVLVEPVGYLVHVAAKMVETLEIALWGTVIAILIGFPLAIGAARNITHASALRGLAGAAISLLRSIPEMISALFLVIAYGFGPIAGILALAFYGAGYLGKVYGEDMEGLDPRPQEALAAGGATMLAQLRWAVLPQAMPRFIAAALYVLDRNMRMATVIGIVGAGGIGQELKGRYDMYDYGHVGTILVVIFIVVFLLDRAAAHLRRAAL
jgi:phosphonate transport system permease protein